MQKVELINLIEKPISGEWGSDGTTIPVIRTTNFSNEGRLNLKDIVLRNIDLKKVENKKLQKGDIIIEKSGGSPTQPVGRVVYFDLEGTYLCNNFTSVLRPKQDKVFPKYLLYQLYVSHLFGFTNNYQNKTTGIINLKLERYVKELQIPLPSLQIQQKIAAILDKADELRQYNKQLITKYDALTQSLFLDMFGDPVRNEKGWTKVDFNKLCDFEKTSIKPENIIDGENYIPLEAIEKVTGSIIKIFKVEKDELKSNKFYFTDEYILYGKLRPYLNKVALPNFSGICSTDIVPLKAKKNITNKFFITQIMRGSGFVSYCNERCSGANLPRISPKEIEKYQIINPPIELQNQFAERVQLIETQKQQAQEALAKSEALFQGLLQQAFKGELVSN